MVKFVIGCSVLFSGFHFSDHFGRETSAIRYILTTICPSSPAFLNDGKKLYKPLY